MGRLVALYARVSTGRQATGLEAQVRSLEAHCEQRGVTGYRLFSDEGVSGAKVSRPGLNQLLDAVRAGEIGTVVVYSFSRFARSTKHLLDSLEEFQRLGVGFVSLTENVDTTSAIGRALFTIISAISQLERELIAERVRNGMLNAKAKGKQIGRAKTRPSELIRHLAEQGHSYREIARLARCSHGAIAEELRELRSERGDTPDPEHSRLVV